MRTRESIEKMRKVILSSFAILMLLSPIEQADSPKTEDSSGSNRKTGFARIWKRTSGCM